MGKQNSKDAKRALTGNDLGVKMEDGGVAVVPLVIFAKRRRTLSEKSWSGRGQRHGGVL